MRREVRLLLGAVGLMAILLLVLLLLRPGGTPLCTFSGGLGDDPIPPGYEHCFGSTEP